MFCLTKVNVISNRKSHEYFMIHEGRWHLVNILWKIWKRKTKDWHYFIKLHYRWKFKQNPNLDNRTMLRQSGAGGCSLLASFCCSPVKWWQIIWHNPGSLTYLDILPTITTTHSISKRRSGLLWGWLLNQTQSTELNRTLITIKGGNPRHVSYNLDLNCNNSTFPQVPHFPLLPFEWISEFLHQSCKHKLQVLNF